jgi:hypothetical protein
VFDVDTYPCPKCGGVADEVTGCHRCGRAHDPAAAELAQLRHDMAGLDDERRRLAADRSSVDRRRDELLRQRQALTDQITRQLAAEQAGGVTTAVPVTTPAALPVSAPALGPVTEPASRPLPVVAPPAIPRQPGPRPPEAWPAAGHPAETSSRSAQNAQLTLGGVLLAISAIVVAGVYYSTTASSGRAAVLAIATTVFLGVPALLNRKTFAATSETIASIGLLLVLLDGYTAYKADLAGIAAVPPALYASVLFALVTGVAAAYRFATHLRAPQFAGLLTVQPLLPLVALNFHFGQTRYAGVFAVVAAFNLGAVVIFGLQLRILAAGRFRPRLRPSTVDTSEGVGWPRMLRELAWLLFAGTLTTSVALAADSLLRATTVGPAVGAAAALVLAAGIGLIAGQVQTDDRLRTYAGAAATLAIIAAVSRVNYLALPDYTLVLTAALAAAIAVASRALPTASQRGPALGALFAAGVSGVVVLIGTVRTSVAVISAATTPRVWSADVGHYAARVQTQSWQVPLAALLLTAFAVLVVGRSWRANTLVLGATVLVLALPGTGLAWWAPSLLAVAVSVLATWAALASPSSTAVAIRSGAATLLSLYAIAASLERAGLTAAVCSALGLAAVATVIAAAQFPEQFGPYRARVADIALGGAAFTLPIAVATFAWLGDAPADVILPITMATTALGVVGAAVSQAATRIPRTASAGGALAASAGGVVLSAFLPGVRLVDIGVAGLVLAAALATAIGGPAGDRESTVDNGRRSLVDRNAVAAGLATAALIVALARLGGVIAPGIGLVTTEAMVLLTALAVRILPPAWRSGPRLGAVAVGGSTGLVLGAGALIEAGHAAAASTPFWHADLAGWTHRVAGTTPYGTQVPIGLLLAAAAAWVLLPRLGADLGFVLACLAAVSLPAVLGLAWSAAVLIAGGLAVVTGIGAALVAPGPDGVPPAIRRLVLAFVLGGYGVLVAGATSTSTGLVLTAYVAAGVVVASLAQLRSVPGIVPGTATAASLAAAPGAAATLVAAGGASTPAVLTAALLVAALGAPIVLLVRRQPWGTLPAYGVGGACVVITAAAGSAFASTLDSQAWAAAAALVAATAIAAGTPREMARQSTVEASGPVGRSRRASIAIVLTVLPSALIAAISSAPAWLSALGGPYRTLRAVWHGYGQAPPVERAGTAVITLALLAATAAIVALTLRGRRYVLAAVLPPLAALAVVAPAAIGAPTGTTSWVALAVAVITGFGAALSPPVLPSAAAMLRVVAAVVCILTGAAGMAGSLATSSGTLIALAVAVAAGAAAATLGRDPSARTVAWFVAAAAAFAFPVTALLAAGGQLHTGAFYVLAICGVLSGVAWQLARSRPRRPEAAVVELTIGLGAVFALTLTVDSARYAAAVLTIWGLLLGVATLRRGRSAELRRWLVRSALAAELVACWLLLYSVRVPLTEAYTLPFAAVALLAGALELRNNRELSSWAAYGPALVGGFGPSVVLVLIGQDAVARWVTLLVAAVLAVIVGSAQRQSAPVVTGSTVAVLVALVEMIRLLARGQVAGGLLVAVAGGVLVAFGALSEQRRRTGTTSPRRPRGQP